MPDIWRYRATCPTCGEVTIIEREDGDPGKQRIVVCCKHYKRTSAYTLYPHSGGYMYFNAIVDVRGEIEIVKEEKHPPRDSMP
jgi:hypothetical protein